MHTTCITSVCDGQTLPVRGVVNASALSVDTCPFHCYSTMWFYVMFCHFHNLRGTETQTRSIHRTLSLKKSLVIVLGVSLTKTKFKLSYRQMIAGIDEKRDTEQTKTVNPQKSPFGIPRGYIL